jgi:hypothetical protein
MGPETVRGEERQTAVLKVLPQLAQLRSGKKKQIRPSQEKHGSRKTLLAEVVFDTTPSLKISHTTAVLSTS